MEASQAPECPILPPKQLEPCYATTLGIECKSLLFR